MKPILVIGSTCVDIMIKIDHLPHSQENLHPTSQSMALGGCAYNVASILNLFEIPHTFISPVGGGIYGDYVKKHLEQQGISIPIYLPEQENGCCYCLVEASGERTFMSYHGVEYRFQKEWMNDYEIADYSMIYLCGLEIGEDTGIQLIEYLEEHPGPTICFAPGPRGILIGHDQLNRLLALHPLLHVNEIEALELSHCSQVEEAAKVLQTMTHNTVIITLGERGAYCREADGTTYAAPGIPVDVVDTIGAGDAHIGTILSCLAKDRSLKEAIVKA
ncbi:MAG: PfkB family carbohydrate kinase, partial [Hungatella sp.]